MSVRVTLSSGDVFYVDAELIEVEHRLYAKGAFPSHLVMVGNRAVNPWQVVGLEAVREVEVSSIHTPERLED